jgi:hypothetical protein
MANLIGANYCDEWPRGIAHSGEIARRTAQSPRPEPPVDAAQRRFCMPAKVAEAAWAAVSPLLAAAYKR